MDDLELPRDRANLSLFSNCGIAEFFFRIASEWLKVLTMMMIRFEIIDSDGSGTLQVVELVQGLLKIRGEAGGLGEAAVSRVKGRALRHAIHPSFAR